MQVELSHDQEPRGLGIGGNRVGAMPRKVCFRPAWSDGRRPDCPRRPGAVSDHTLRPVAEICLRGALDQTWLHGPGGGGPLQRLAPRLLLRTDDMSPLPGDFWRVLVRLTHRHHLVGKRHGIRRGVEPVLHPLRRSSGLIVQHARHGGG
jgi:hypothetical protein